MTIFLFFSLFFPFFDPECGKRSNFSHFSFLDTNIYLFLFDIDVDDERFGRSLG